MTVTINETVYNLKVGTVDPKVIETGKLVSIMNNYEAGAVESVNNVSPVDGNISLNQDNIPDGTTYKQFSTTEKSKLSGIESGADVTDAVNIASSINGVSEKTTPADADAVALIDSASSNVLKKLSWTNIKATLKTYFDGLYALIGHNHDLTYLGISAKAADSDKLDGNDSTAFATAGHNHTGVYEPVRGADDNYVTDAEKIVIGNTSGTNTGDNATNSQYSGLASSKENVLTGATAKATIADNDRFIQLDSEATNATKYGLWSLVKSTLKTYFDGLYNGILTFGIANTNAVKIDSADVTSGEIARFTANGLESRSNAEIKAQLAYLTDLIDDQTPQLYADLDCNEKDLDNVKNIIHDQGTASDFVIQNIDQDKDIKFSCNDGGSQTDIMILDGSEGQLSGYLKATTGVVSGVASFTRTYYEVKTWTVQGEIKVPSSGADVLPPFEVNLISGQTAKIVKWSGAIESGTSATFKLQQSDGAAGAFADITGYTSFAISGGYTNPSASDAADYTLADGQVIQPVCTAVSGTPKNLMLNVVIEYTLTIS